MLHKINESTKILNKKFFNVFKLEVQNFFITLLLFFSSLLFFVTPIIIMFFTNNLLITTFSLVLTIAIFLIFYNGKRIAYFASVNLLRKTGNTQFSFYMENYVKGLSKTVSISLYQTAFLLISILIYVLIIKIFNLNFEQTITKTIFILILVLYFLLNEIFIAPILIVMAISDKDLIWSFKTYVKKIIPFLSKRLVYIVVLTLVAILTAIFSFMIFPPLVFMLVLYPILILSHIGDIKDLVN